MNTLLKDKQMNDIYEQIKEDNEDLLSNKIVITFENKEISLVPLFVEGYRTDDSGPWKDEATHGLPEQRNRKGKLYIHYSESLRKSGVDYVHSNKEDVAYSTLIKLCYVYFDNEKYLCSIAFLSSFLAHKLNLSFEEFKKIFNDENKKRQYSIKVEKNDLKNGVKTGLRAGLTKGYIDLDLASYAPETDIKDGTTKKAYSNYKNYLIKTFEDKDKVINKKYFEKEGIKL